MLQSNLGDLKYGTRASIHATNQPSNMIKYERIIEYQYTASADGEKIIILPSLIGALRIVRIDNEIKPMAFADFSFNPNSGQINLLNEVSLGVGQTLFIIYAVLITS